MGEGEQKVDHRQGAGVRVDLAKERWGPPKLAESRDRFRWPKPKTQASFSNVSAEATWVWASHRPRPIHSFRWRTGKAALL